MRILMTADASEGVWRYVMELARALRPREVEILIAVMGPALSCAQREEAARLGHVGLSEKPFALEWMKDPWREVTSAGDWLLGLEERFEPQVIHLNHYCHGSLPWSAPVVITAHGCVLSWWQAVHGEQSPHSWSRYHAEVAAGLRGANLVIASTRSMLDGLTRLYAPIPRLMQYQNAPRFPAFRTVPHGRDASLFHSLEKRNEILCVSAPGDDAQNLLFFKRMAQDLPWPVYLIGRDDLEGADGFDSLGILDEPGRAERMGAAAIFALPTRYEPFGFSVLEAAISGCALVLGNIPCLRETWGEAAIFAPPDDSQAFQSAIAALIEDNGLREEMAGRARARALAFTPEQMAESVFDAYRSVIAPRLLAAQEVG
jgi:glycosyltransferase involved in cell wall biosynthesis